MRKILSLVGLSVVGSLLGCGGVFRPFAYAEPDNCAVNPGVCGAGSECNFQREVCEPSVALPQLARPVWRQQAKLSASDGGISDFFGAASALSGDTVLLGAPFSDVESTANAGAAYAFVLDPDHGVWKQQAKLVAGDAATGALAGYALALAGDTALLTARAASPGGVAQAGAAYLFARSPAAATWVQQAKLVASDGAAGDKFGSQAALAADVAVVGAAAADSPGKPDAGAVYFFARTAPGGTWMQLQPRLAPADLGPGDNFGAAIALSGDTALVGAPLADLGNSADAGAAYVFVRSAASGLWTQQAKLVASGGAAGDAFGSAVALSGNTALIGAPQAHLGDKVSAGAAYIFERDPASGAWTQQAKLTAADGQVGDSLGFSVALSAERAAVGAVYADVNGQVGAGAVYLFRREAAAAAWPLEVRLAAADAARLDRGAFSITLAGNTLGIGAPEADLGGAMDAGAGYIFQYAKQNGDPCAAARECHSSFCVDGVCCDSACGNSDPTDCQACSAAAGAIITSDGDGTCRPRRPGRLCRASSGGTDPAESCDGQALSCPPDIR